MPMNNARGIRWRHRTRDLNGRKARAGGFVPVLWPVLGSSLRSMLDARRRRKFSTSMMWWTHPSVLLFPRIVLWRSKEF